MSPTSRMLFWMPGKSLFISSLMAVDTASLALMTGMRSMRATLVTASITFCPNSMVRSARRWVKALLKLPGPAIWSAASVLYTSGISFNIFLVGANISGSDLLAAFRTSSTALGRYCSGTVRRSAALRLTAAAGKSPVISRSLAASVGSKSAALRTSLAASLYALAKKFLGPVINLPMPGTVAISTPIIKFSMKACLVDWPIIEVAKSAAARGLIDLSSL